MKENLELQGWIKYFIRFILIVKVTKYNCHFKKSDKISYFYPIISLVLNVFEIKYNLIPKQSERNNDRIVKIFCYGFVRNLQKENVTIKIKSIE